MKKINSLLAMFVACLTLFTACDSNDDATPEFKAGEKEGILLVTFGSSFEAPHKTFATIDEAFKAEFPNEEIRWAYTADIILNRLRKGDSEGGWLKTPMDLDTPIEAIKKMALEGYGKIKVQSLHIIPGEEYDDLVEDANAMMKEYDGVKIAVGAPLLNSDDDLTKVATVLTSVFATTIAKEEPILLMGHGTPHHANNVRYNEIEAKLQAKYSKFFIGTVDPSENYPAPMIGDILPKLSALSLTNENVTISPLMSIAGDHANNDMNSVTGETDVEEQSWRERLEAENYAVTDVMKGLGDYTEIRQIWIDHLKAVKL